MKYILLLASLTIQFILFSQVPANYYNSASGLSGYALKTELKNIITNNYYSVSYSDLYTIYETSDADLYYENDGTLLDMYSEKPSGVDLYSYAQINANHCPGGTQAAEGECFNREHIVPQVAFNYQFPMKSDAHFVFPTDGFVNAERGSLAFGEVSSPIYTSSNGSKKGNNTTPGYSSYVFEPIDEFKGDIARALFYFATRYEDSVAVWNHTMFNNTSDQVFEDWFLDILLDWHAQDPVTDRDSTRNNVIYNSQNNANPFVNHPEYVNLIWAPTDVISPSTPTNLIASNVTSNSVELNWNASTDNYVVNGYDVYRNGTLLTSTVSNAYTDFSLSSNTNYSYYVVAKDNTPNYSGNSNTVSIMTLAIPEYLIVDSFENACLNSSFETYSSASDKDWTCQSVYGFNNSGCININGFQENELSDDWLISANKILFSNYNSIKLSCYLQYAYGNMSLALLYSANYTSGTDPSLASWTAIPNVVIETGNGSSSTSVQNIINADISGISVDAHIAFRYVSSGNPTRWNVDNFSITGVENVIADNINPTIPTNLIASNVTTNSVDLNWTASTDNVAVTTYDIYRDGSFITSTLTTNYTDNTLSQNTSYEYYVVAKDAAGNVSGNSNSVNITTLQSTDNINPSTPTNLVANNVTTNSVDLNWTASIDNIAVTIYDIYRDGFLISSVASTNYTDNGLTTNTSYSYNVVAKDAAGNPSSSSNSVSVTTEVEDSTNVNLDEIYFKTLKVFPNPTESNSIKIVSDEAFSEVKIYSVLGELIKHHSDLNLNYLEIKSLEKGIYFLKIFSNEKSIQKNIIVL